MQLKAKAEHISICDSLWIAGTNLVFADQEPDYEADLDRPIEAEQVSKYRYAW